MSTAPALAADKNDLFADQRELVTAREVADKLKLKTSTINAWTRSGRVPCHRLAARVIRYRLSEVMDALGS